MKSHAEETMDNLEERRKLLLLCGWSEPELNVTYEREIMNSTRYFDKKEYLGNWLVNPDGILCVNGTLPQVTTSLDAWYEWVWPELEKLGYFEVGLLGGSANLTRVSDLVEFYTISGEGDTKIAALVNASMEALG
jgi:hypothetical protein